MAQLTSHLKNCSKQQRSMYCEICDTSFECGALYKQHQLIYHPEDRPCNEALQQKLVMIKNSQWWLNCYKPYFCDVCHKEFTTKTDFTIHMQQHYIRDNRGLLKCEHCPTYYANKQGLTRHYRVKHPPKRVVSKEENYYIVSDKEYCENSEQTEQVGLVKSEPNETDSSTATVTHNGIIKKTAEDKNDNILLESDIPASDREFSEENDLSELVSALKSEPSSPESPYVNLEDDKFTVEETDVKIEKSNAELTNSSPAFIGSKPEMVANNDPRLVDEDQNQQKELYECHACHQNFINASSLHQHITNSRGTCKLKCWICCECFLSEAQLKSHIAAHVRKYSYTCKFCDKSYLYLSDYRSHITRCSQKHIQWHNGNELFSCVCGKRFITKGHLEAHLKTHTENELLICPSKQVVTNETESSIATVTRRKIKRKKVEEHKDVMYHVILPELDPDCAVTSIATGAHKKVKQKKVSNSETHTTHCSQKYMQRHNGNELFSCEICGKRLKTKGYLAIHLKTHAEEKLLTRPSKQVVTNETESSIAAFTRRIVKRKKVEEHKEVMYHVILPESAPDCIVTSIATGAHEQVKQKNVEEPEYFMLPESDPVDRNVSVRDKEFCETSQLNELMDSETSEASSRETFKISQKNNSSSSSFHRLILPELCPVDRNTNISGKEFCEKRELNELVVYSVKSGPSNPESCKTSQKNHLSTFDHFKLPESNPIDRNVPVSDKELCKKSELNKLVVYSVKSGPSKPESFNSSLKIHSPSSSSIDHVTLPLTHCSPSHIATHVRKYMCKFCDKSYLYLSDYETHITHCSQKHMQRHNGNELFSCEICGKRLKTKGYLAIHLKTHAEDKLLTRPLKQVVTNDTESSIAAVTRRKDKKKKVEEHKDVMYHVILPELDPDCIVTSIATVAHEQVKQENVEEPEDFILPESDPVDGNVPVSDNEFCKKTKLDELVVYSVKSGPSKPESCKSSQKTYSSSSSNGNFSLHLSRAKAFARPNMTNKAVYNAKLVETRKNTVDKQKNHITNHIPDYKGPFKCKRCPKIFACNNNLITHCRLGHPPKNIVGNDTHVSIDMVK